MRSWNWWLNRPRLAAMALDGLWVALAWWFAFQLRFNFEPPADLQAVVLPGALGVAAVYLVVGLLLGVYAQVWRLTSLLEIRRLALAVLLSGLVAAAGTLFVRELFTPRSVIVMHPMLCLIALAGARALARSLNEVGAVGATDGASLVIVGDLDLASQALRGLQGSKQWRAVSVVSPKMSDEGRSVGHVPVSGGLDSLPDALRAAEAKAVLIAVAAGSPTRREALLAAGGHGVAVLTLPTPDDWFADSSKGPRQLRLEDLLGRASVALDQQGLSDLFAGRSVMVTGGAGSIGSELCRQLARFGVQELVVVDASEVGLYSIDQELRRAHPQLQLKAYSANVREFARIAAIAQTHKPTVVLHAAAFKHVPLMEERNEIEALRTNVLGTLHVARAAGECGA
jgi:FlaA1/EpsC-like NDP-sugar epimerase